VRATGPLSDASFKRLIGIVQSPVPAVVSAAAKAKEVTPADPAQASLRYLKSVSLTIDNLKTGTSMGETAQWWKQASQRIDKLPIMNVDPTLVEWGSLISMKLRQLAAAGTVGQNQIRTAVAGVAPVTTDDSYYDERGDYHYLPNQPSAETSRIKQATALQTKTQLQTEALKVFDEVNGSRQKVRVQMTQKYNIEF